MVPTAELAELADLADVRGWRVVLVGDPLQFSAVGRGGMFGLLVDTYGAIELDRVHRFAHDWERDASLRLRRGDLDVARRLRRARPPPRRHPRPRWSEPPCDAWWEHRQAGETSRCSPPTNETVDRLNQRAQQRRLDAGELDPDRPLRAGGPRPAVRRRRDRHPPQRPAPAYRPRRHGPQPRQMDRHRHPPRPRSHRHRPLTAPCAFPADYVAEHVELAYAPTGHGGQGRTVDRALLVLDRPTESGPLRPDDPRPARNEAFVAAHRRAHRVDVFAHCMATDWIDHPPTPAAPSSPG